MMIYCFKSTLILILFATKCSVSEAQTLEKGYITSLFEIEKVNFTPNMDTATILNDERSIISCVYHCQKLSLQSSYFMEHNSTCICNPSDGQNVDKTENLGAQIIHGIRTQKVSKTFIQEGSQLVKRIHKQPEPIDCLELFQQGYNEDGVYVILPPTSVTTNDVWCDMSNGGWTVIQRRQDGSEDFYRDWEEYKNGFGNRAGEYWFGLENIYQMTINTSSLYVYLEAFKKDNVDPFSAFAEYSIFRINDESDKYRLKVEGYKGSCGDSLLYHNNYQFTTKDSDNDNYGTNCAETFNGAWWYNACHKSNLNGLYLDGADTDFGRGINWQGCWGHHYSLKKTVMKIKRNEII